MRWAAVRVRGNVRGALSGRSSSGLLRACVLERARRAERTLQQGDAARVRDGACGTLMQWDAARALECARRAEQTLQQWAAAQVEVKAISEDATWLRSGKALELRDSILTDWSQRLHGRLADAVHSADSVATREGAGC